jgi:hypothetical protein
VSSGRKKGLQNGGAHRNVDCLILLAGDWEHPHILWAINKISIEMLFTMGCHSIMVSSLFIKSHIFLQFAEDMVKQLAHRQNKSKVKTFTHFIFILLNNMQIVSHG